MTLQNDNMEMKKNNHIGFYILSYLVIHLGFLFIIGRKDIDCDTLYSTFNMLFWGWYLIFYYPRPFRYLFNSYNGYAIFQVLFTLQMPVPLIGVYRDNFDVNNLYYSFEGFYPFLSWLNVFYTGNYSGEVGFNYATHNPLRWGTIINEEDAMWGYVYVGAVVCFFILFCLLTIWHLSLYKKEKNNSENSKNASIAMEEKIILVFHSGVLIILLAVFLTLLTGVILALADSLIWESIFVVLIWLFSLFLLKKNKNSEKWDMPIYTMFLVSFPVIITTDYGQIKLYSWGISLARLINSGIEFEFWKILSLVIMIIETGIFILVLHQRKKSKENNLCC